MLFQSNHNKSSSKVKLVIIIIGIIILTFTFSIFYYDKEEKDEKFKIYNGVYAKMSYDKIAEIIISDGDPELPINKTQINNFWLFEGFDTEVTFAENNLENLGFISFRTKAPAKLHQDFLEILVEKYGKFDELEIFDDGNEYIWKLKDVYIAFDAPLDTLVNQTSEEYDDYYIVYNVNF